LFQQACARSNEASQRLETIRGMGVIGATAIAATVPDPKVFGSGRDFAAWIRLVPREDSTGGKQKLGPISKRGDRYLRRILVVGACAVLRYARHKPENGHRVGDAPVGAAFFQRANEVVASKQANRATHSVHHRELALAGVQPRR
jgi:transposase